MNPLHAQFIKRGRRKEFVVLSYKEFLKIQEELEDYHDLRCLLDAKAAEKNAPTISLDELKARLGMQ